MPQIGAFAPGIQLHARDTQQCNCDQAKSKGAKDAAFQALGAAFAALSHKN
jgi:hypothetical protein